MRALRNTGPRGQQTLAPSHLSRTATSDAQAPEFADACACPLVSAGAYPWMHPASGLVIFLPDTTANFGKFVTGQEHQMTKRLPRHKMAHPQRRKMAHLLRRKMAHLPRRKLAHLLRRKMTRLALKAQHICPLPRNRTPLLPTTHSHIHSLTTPPQLPPRQRRKMMIAPLKALQALTRLLPARCCLCCLGYMCSVAQSLYVCHYIDLKRMDMSRIACAFRIFFFFSCVDHIVLLLTSTCLGYFSL